MWALIKSNKITQFHLAIVVAIMAWSAILYGLYQWASKDQQEHFVEMVVLKAESLANQNQALRAWVGERGGVYVEVDDKMKPHPLQAHVAERDIETPSGRKLTLANSFMVLRAVSENFKLMGNDTVRLVSNQPMNPENTTDDWEKRALVRLEEGAPKVEEFTTDDGGSVFRLIYPMVFKKKCMPCHQGRIAPGQKIAGGLSVIVDKEPYDTLGAQVLEKITAGYLGIWLIGIFGLLVFDVTGAHLLKDIELMATHDSLTRLLNRRELERLLVKECAHAERYGKPLSVMILDLDYFKRVNDTYGHQAGDEVLRVVGETITRNIRKIDIAGRYGGDELMVITPDIDCTGAEILANRLREAVKSAAVQLRDGRTINVNVCIGVSCYSSERETPDAIVKSADDVLYEAKAGGRDRVAFAR